MSIFIPNSNKIKAIDKYTIDNEPIESIDLMERASLEFTSWFEKKFPNREKKILVFCGTGNNGGDGLAVSRLLLEKFYNLTVILWGNSENCSSDCSVNLRRLTQTGLKIVMADSDLSKIPPISEDAIIIDALLGSGLDRPLEGKLNDLIIKLNTTNSIKVSIDIPTGLFADSPNTGISFAADEVLSFEFPKLAFLLPENAGRIKNWEYRSIGLQLSSEMSQSIPNLWLTTLSIKNLIKEPGRFSHKGTHGKAFLVCGKKGYSGAAVLSSSSCLKVGCGLLITHLPKACLNIVQQAVPEAICHLNSGKKHLEGHIEIPDKIKVIGIGPGIGTRWETAHAIKNLLKSYDKPMVIDADALNIIAENDFFALIPKNSILSPHPGEFRKLFGTSANDFDELELQRKKSIEHQIYIIFKGAYSRISCPDGKVYFNSTGNPGLAKAGTGDVLTGILTGLLARGYSAEEAALIGVHLHGLAADIVLENQSVETIMASDLIENLGKAFTRIKEEKNPGSSDCNKLEPQV